MSINYVILAIALAAIIYFAVKTKSKDHRSGQTGVATTSGNVDHGDFILDTDGITTLPDTGGAFFAGKNCRNVVRFKLKSIDFMARNREARTAGHGGLQLRSYEAGIKDEMYRGIGPIFGFFYPGQEAPNGMASLEGQAAIEVWQKGAEPPGFQHVKPETVSPPIEDGLTLDGMVLLEYMDGWWTCYYKLGHYVSPLVRFAEADSNIRPQDTALSLFKFGPGTLVFSELTSEWSLL
jgi:hypothetical protein